ncbi:SAP domain-containing protein [Candidatus Babeliales bacterium]|nr:SAP domain-containing protein [Candidatus Babeliales bacterium]
MPVYVCLLTDDDFSLLYDAIHYMKIAELRELCSVLSIPENGAKKVLISRIIKYLRTGSVEKIKEIPVSSRAKNFPPQLLKADALMLHGSYKNDAKTRQLFKSLIGPQFHFTAFGIDWLNERWLQGQPPTYQEFADYWIAETGRRCHEKVKPKKEWAYINFLQRAKSRKDYDSKADLMLAWKKMREEKVALVREIIKKQSE